MAYCHIAHDCIVGDRTVFANGTTLAGHVTIEDWVVLGGATLIHQFCRLGAHCFTAGGSGITRDIPPFLVVQGNPAEARGINLTGIRRRNFSDEDMAGIKQAYKLLYVSDTPFAQAKIELAELAKSSATAKRMSEFVENARQLLAR
jgi:UDP-N-acetylglucosamine acyltransferase